MHQADAQQEVGVGIAVTVLVDGLFDVAVSLLRGSGQTLSILYGGFLRAYGGESTERRCHFRRAQTYVSLGEIWVGAYGLFILFYDLRPVPL